MKTPTPNKACLVFTIAALGLGVASCTPTGTLIGAGAAVGVAAYEERGLNGVARDLRIATAIKDLYLRSDHRLMTAIGIEVFEGRVLLTGHVKEEQMRADAVRLAWSAGGVLDVINEIVVTDDSDIFDAARDGWVTSQLRTKLTFDSEVLAINYAVETSGGVVYLIGIAQSADELERVKNHARGISYVKRVISHVRIKGPSHNNTNDDKAG